MSISAVSLSSETLQTLFSLLFGEESLPEDVSRWNQQPIQFSEDVIWGLKQKIGGPCGVLAPIQAFICYELLFGEDKLFEDGMKLDLVEDPILALGTKEIVANACVQAMVSAIARVLFQAQKSENECSITVVYCNEGDERFYCVTITKEHDLIPFLLSIYPSFSLPTAVIQFLYSLMLTRGVSTIRNDMDDPLTPLVCRFGHCSQELVNLLLTGFACSNVFDGIKSLGGLLVRGICQSYDVGFLSLHEVLRYNKVGTYYKAPNFPIWVIAGTNHYTVSFGLNVDSSRLTAQEAQLLQARLVFSKFDPFQQLAAVLQDVSLPVLKGKIDDGGIVLWDVLQAYINEKVSISSSSNAPASSSSLNWSCNVCTFINNGAKNCEMCNSPAPKNDNASASLPDFSIFHFNGISEKVSRLSVKASQKLIVHNVNSDDSTRGLREILQTKWNCVIEYSNPNNVPNVD